MKTTEIRVAVRVEHEDWFPEDILCKRLGRLAASQLVGQVLHPTLVWHSLTPSSSRPAAKVVGLKVDV